MVKKSDGERVHEFAEALREARSDARLTQEDLAHELGLTSGTISGWERGDRSTLPLMPVVAAIESILGVEDHRLMEVAGYVTLAEQEAPVPEQHVGQVEDRRQIMLPPDLDDQSVSFIRYVVDYLVTASKRKGLSNPYLLSK